MLKMEVIGNRNLTFENVLLIVNTDCICRLCLRTGGALSDIFDEQIDSKIISDLASFASIDIKHDDNLPVKICHRCRYMIEMCCEFRSLILNSNIILLQSLNEENDSNESTLKNSEASNEEQSFNNTSDDIDKDMVKRELFNEQDLNIELNLDAEDSNIESEYALSDKDADAIKSNNSNFETKVIRQLKKRKLYSNNGLRNKLIHFSAKLDKNIQCLLCLELLKDEKSLKKHIDEHVQGTSLEPYYMLAESNIVCKLCSKKFNYRFSFLIHQREHLNLKPFHCKHAGCSISFFSKSALRQHLPIHADRNFICSVCAIGFKRKSDLTAHERIHEDAGIKYECPICGILCKTRFTKAAHMKKHQIKRMYKCSTCLKEYFSESELRRHEYVHLPNKCFSCNQCSSAYYSRSALARHEKRHHMIDASKSIIGKCPLCKQIHKSISKKICMQYLKEINAEEFSHTCTECGKGYFDETCLSKHAEQCIPSFTSQLTDGCTNKEILRPFSCDPFSSSQLDSFQL